MARMIAPGTLQGLWIALPVTADDQAAAEHAFRFIGAHAARPVYKWKALPWVVGAVASRRSGWWENRIRCLIDANKATMWAWDRLVAAGVIKYVPRKPLVFNL